MANGLELAQAYIQIIPSFEGISSEVANILAPAAEEAGNKAGDKGGKSFLGKLGKVVAGGAAAAFASITAAGGALVSGVKDVAAYGDEIDKMSQKIGISSTAYQEWDAILQHSGTNISVMQSSMKTLVNAASNGSDAFKKLGISEKDIASMNQEELFAATIAGLQNMDSSTERAALAQKLLGKGATEMGALLNTSAEDTEAMRQRVHELGGVLGDEAVKNAAAFQDSLQDMKTAFSGLSTNLLAEFMPSMTTVMGGLTEIFAGNGETGIAMIKNGISGLVTQLSETIPQILELGTSIVTSLAGAIIENLPQLMTAGMDAIVQFADGIMEQLPTLLETGLELIITLGEGVAEQLPTFIDNALDGIMSLIDALMENLPTFIESGVTLIEKLLDGIIAAVPKIVDYIPQMITTLINGIVQNLPRIIQAGIQLLLSLTQGLIKAIPQLVSSLPKVISAIWDTIKKTDWLELGKTIIRGLINGLISMVSSIIQAAGELIKGIWDKFTNIDWKNLGKNIIDGIKNGVKNAATHLVDSVKEAAKKALDGVKKFLGIKSPSRVFEAQVGEMIPLGAAEGIENETDSLKSAVKQMSKEAIGSFDTDFSVYGGNAPSTQPETDENLLRMIMQAATMIVTAINNKEMGVPSDDYIGKAAMSYIRSEQRRVGTAVV